MLAIAMLFALILVFTTTKRSKIIVSNKPPHTDEQATLPGNAPLAFKEDHDHHAVAVLDDVSNAPTQTDKQAILPRSAPTADTQQERLNGLDVMQRQMAQAARRAPAPQTETISEVDLQQLKTLAAQGSASAQNQLGQLYDSGRRGVPQDYAKARQWYEQAAAQGHTGTMLNLGLLYIEGQGVPQDDAKAQQWWEKAAAQGDANAQKILEIMFAYTRNARTRAA
jgi:TPR repeat protein